MNRLIIELDQLSVSRMASSEPIYFISGHMELSPNVKVDQKWFDEHYVPLLQKALTNPKAKFVIGDAKTGVDQLAQQYLLEQKVNCVTVYHMHVKPRINLGNWKTIGSFKNDRARDTAMTANSTADILYVEPSKQVFDLSELLKMDKRELLILESKKNDNSNKRLSGTEQNRIRRLIFSL
jgi:hypothetical protein